MGHVSKHLKVAYVDEYFTSQKCCTCQASMPSLHPQRRVRRTKELKVVEITGKYCATCKRAVARDINAARHILQAGMAEYWGQLRPAYL